ncbi:hypothetical protein QT990_18165 [Microcoleus sp. T3_B1]
MPVPQKINFLVEQAEKPVANNGARCELPGVKSNLGHRPARSIA